MATLFNSTLRRIRFLCFVLVFPPVGLSVGLCYPQLGEVRNPLQFPVRLLKIIKAMEPTQPNFAASALVFPFVLTVLAGLATALGSALAFFTKRTNLRLLA
jgi:hypothetical protein